MNNHCKFPWQPWLARLLMASLMLACPPFFQPVFAEAEQGPLVEANPGTESSESTIANELPSFALEGTTTGSGDRQASEAVREILKLQQQLGGSILSDSDALRPLPSGPRQRPVKGTGRPGASKRQGASQVELLRDVAWHLEISAHWLEQIDHYQQADTLRSMAQALRLEARNVKRRE